MDNKVSSTTATVGKRRYCLAQRDGCQMAEFVVKEESGAVDVFSPPEMKSPAESVLAEGIGIPKNTLARAPNTTKPPVMTLSDPES